MQIAEVHFRKLTQAHTESLCMHAHTKANTTDIYRHKYTRMYAFHKHTLCNVWPAVLWRGDYMQLSFCLPLCSRLKGLTTTAPPLALSHILPHRERGTDLLSACRLCQSVPFSPYWLLIVKPKVKRLQLKVKLYMCIIQRASAWCSLPKSKLLNFIFIFFFCVTGNNNRS